MGFWLAVVWMGGLTALLGAWQPAHAQATPLCRLGMNTLGVRTEAYDLQPLRISWYLNTSATVIGTPPAWLEHFPVIQLAQVGADGFSFSPNGAVLDGAVAAHPGANWLIGNEPDRRHYQNDLLPETYAHAYHDVRAYILARDPTARFLAGSIVQPTPLRLQYLDRVLAAYQARYGAPLPADGWSLHNFILNERSCDAYPDSCWGAEIPPGLDATEGMVISDLNDHVRVDIFSQQIERFRGWMAANGYRHTPLYLTEYGVLMPASLGFPPERVNAFMSATFDYLLAATDPALGYAPDGHRLVQGYAWYATVAPSYNGSLFVSIAGTGPYDPPFARTAIGDHFAAYAGALNAAPDMTIVNIEVVAHPLSTPLTATLIAQVANAGHGQAPVAATVQFYDGDPLAGGAPIGAPQPVVLGGCGAATQVELTWQDIDPGPGLARQIFAVVTATGDAQPANNSGATWLLLGDHWEYIPLIQRQQAVKAND